MPSPSASTSTWMRAGTWGVGRFVFWVMANWMLVPSSRTPTLARSITASFEPGEPGWPAAGVGRRSLDPVSTKASTTPSATPRLRIASVPVPSAPTVTVLARATVDEERLGSVCQPRVATALPLAVAHGQVAVDLGLR